MYYTFRQNNSGGIWDINEDVNVFVIIEANSVEDANYRAESDGIYFDGCLNDIDCGCCGDRWSRTEKYYSRSCIFDSLMDEVAGSKYGVILYLSIGKLIFSNIDEINFNKDILYDYNLGKLI